MKAKNSLKFAGLEIMSFISLLVGLLHTSIIFMSYMYVSTGYFYSTEIFTYLSRYIFGGNVELWKAVLSLIVYIDAAFLILGLLLYVFGHSFALVVNILEKFKRVNSSTGISILNFFGNILNSIKSILVPLAGTSIIYVLSSGSIYYSDIFHVFAVLVCPLTIGPVIFLTNAGSFSPLTWGLIILILFVSAILLPTFDTEREPI